MMVVLVGYSETLCSHMISWGFSVPFNPRSYSNSCCMFAAAPYPLQGTSSPAFLENEMNLWVFLLTMCRFSGMVWSTKAPCSGSEPSSHCDYGILLDTLTGSCTAPLSKTIPVTPFQLVLQWLACSACLLVFCFGGAAVISAPHFHKSTMI